ncbi:4926_t:CDS:10 [Ambispora leptoticha]|uniref:4926_t:CDS:1 n=1 Tax=Ambispora leptoticha TaxID=144679 RepID=A0A9N8ZXW1_9GLOM|nr:4926_t:CDS:10 [Ambispora leptoticha]
MDDLFNESHFLRFSSGGRTNIYGLSVVETPLSGKIPASPDFPSGILQSMPNDNIDDHHQHMPTSSNDIKYKHVFASSFYGITCFVSAAGYWNTIELQLDKDIGEIVSMDSFYSDKIGLVLAFTTVHVLNSPKNTTEVEGQHQFMLRIYFLNDLGSVLCMEDALFKLTEKCQKIQLTFTPMQLTHTIIRKAYNNNNNSTSELCLLLCGTDGGVHLYTFNFKNQKWEEEAVQPYFPFLSEVADSKSNILSLVIFDFGIKKIIAAGCQNGILHLAILQKDSNVNNSEGGEKEGNFIQLEESQFAPLFSPITSISIFTTSTSKQDPGDVHMLVTCAVEQVLIYRFVDSRGIKYPVQLKECTQYDSVLCSHVMDVDWDGRNEILVGTYGREMLIYKQEENDNDPTFQLIWRRSFAHPIYRIDHLDLNQDGLEELVVTSQYGIHVFQPNLHKAKELLNQMFEELDHLRIAYINAISTVKIPSSSYKIKLAAIKLSFIPENLHFRPSHATTCLHRAFRNLNNARVSLYKSNSNSLNRPIKPQIRFNTTITTGTCSNSDQEPNKDPKWLNLSFYTFNPIEDARLGSLHQTMLKNFKDLGILGRIYISTEGINAQLSCPSEKINALRKYCDEEIPKFFGKVDERIDDGIGEFNYSTVHGDRASFLKLIVRIRNQIVVDGLKPGSYDIKKQPKHLSAQEWHHALSNTDIKPIVIDMRNHYESEVGHFEDSIRPDVDTFRDSIKAMNEICQGKQDEEIFMYCTGGIRCSKAGAILRSNGFKFVNVLKGGVTAYGRFVAANPFIKSLYKGRNFTFDKRLGEPITDDIVSQCHTCDCKIRTKHTCGNRTCFEMVDTWDKMLQEKNSSDESSTILIPNNSFPTTATSTSVIPAHDDVKPGISCWYDHAHRVRPKLVIERLGDPFSSAFGGKAPTPRSSPLGDPFVRPRQSVFEGQPQPPPSQQPPSQESNINDSNSALPSRSSLPENTQRTIYRVPERSNMQKLQYGEGSSLTPVNFQNSNREIYRGNNPNQTSFPTSSDGSTGLSTPRYKIWTPEEKDLLVEAVKKEGSDDKWDLISQNYFKSSRSPRACMMAWDRFLQGKLNPSGQRPDNSNYPNPGQRINIMPPNSGPMPLRYSNDMPNSAIPRYNNTTRRVWTNEEIDTLFKGVEKYGENFELISSEMFHGLRTENACRIKYENTVANRKTVTANTSEPLDIRIGELLDKEWYQINDTLGKQADKVQIIYETPSSPSSNAWTKEENDILFKSVKEFGDDWTKTLERLPGRTLTAAKNRYGDIVWTLEEITAFEEAYAKYGEDWAKIAKEVPTKTSGQCWSYWLRSTGKDLLPKNKELEDKSGILESPYRAYISIQFLEEPPLEMQFIRRQKWEIFTRETDTIVSPKLNNPAVSIEEEGESKENDQSVIYVGQENVDDKSINENQTHTESENVYEETLEPIEEYDRDFRREE